MHRVLFVSLLISRLPEVGKAELSFQTEKVGVVDTLVRLFYRLEVEHRSGYIFPTNSFVAGRNMKEEPLRYSQSLHARYSFQFTPSTNFAQIFGGVYQGIEGVRKFMGALSIPRGTYLYYFSTSLFKL